MTTFREWLKKIEETGTNSGPGTSTGDIASVPQKLGGDGYPFVRGMLDCMTGKDGKCGLGGKVQDMKFSTKVAGSKSSKK